MFDVAVMVIQNVVITSFLIYKMYGKGHPAKKLKYKFKIETIFVFK